MRALATASLAVLGAMLLLGAAGAQAAPRYASPTGSNETCSDESPCSLKIAIEKAGDGGEVIAKPGEYAIATTIFSSHKELRIHGQAGSPPPELVWNQPTYGLSIEGENTVFSDFRLRRDGEAGYVMQCVGQAIIERIESVAVGAANNALNAANGCLIRDSLLRVEGANSRALYTSGTGGASVTLRNLTAIATGPESFGIVARNVDPFMSPDPYTLRARNTIADGGRADILVEGISGPAIADIGRSNFDDLEVMPGSSATDAGGNQSAAPLFADAAGGDFREALGSPTIDAGAADPLLGPLDLAGGARIQGPAPDIGAYETGVSPRPTAILPAPAGELRALAIAPRFRAAKAGGAILSRKRKRAPVGGTVRFELSAAATVAFSVERRTEKTRNGHRKVAFRPAGAFDRKGVGGANSFKFSGRLGRRALKPGRYRLVGTTGAAVRRAAFTIVG